MNSANAWLLPLSTGEAVALGERELIQVLSEQPGEFAVPGAPGMCANVTLWGSTVVPIVDIEALADPDVLASEGSGVLIIVGCSAPSGAQYAALRIAGVPERINVDAAQAAQVDDLHPWWRRCAHSGFHHEGLVVPVLDLHRLLGQSLHA